MRILLVEDEDRIASFIARGLKEARYVVDIAKDGEKAAFMAEINDYDLLILDIMLPGKDGISVCKELRSKGRDMPILMLSAKDTTDDKVRGLNFGADDYLAKPFVFKELLARVQALLRRQKPSQGTILKVGDLELNQLTHRVSRKDKEIELTSKEYTLLEYLMLNTGKVVSRTMISEHVWHEDFDSLTNVIDVFMKYLRNKIDKGFKKQLIHTIRGSGYCLKE
ncbi:MAG: response regulator transcription factor [Candidatus Omnitrophica bacterium]|nr:response regulator transcription factor [Candidatus Omnitrophota bacterium]MBU1091086.1 response regulator transcription factor [Candidatus Omnitrophota bacterium]MBU1906001.1 response regulator transcription factor [Candidatus Omnitrophota bacterium]